MLFLNHKKKLFCLQNEGMSDYLPSFSRHYPSRCHQECLVKMERCKSTVPRSSRLWFMLKGFIKSILKDSTSFHQKWCHLVMQRRWHHVLTLWYSISYFSPIWNFITVLAVIIYCGSKVSVIQIRLIQCKILITNSIKFQFRQ